MSKTINKTQPTEIEAGNFAKQNFPPNRQKEILQLVNFFEKITGKKCVMWNKIFALGDHLLEHYLSGIPKAICYLGRDFEQK
jgi:hypothetical protein